jgi:all-trans-8'-apo-beta-carotenal 15,15'-oxygenase
MVCAISLDGEGGAHFVNRFVRTPGFVAERRAGKQLFRSAFNRTLPDGMGVELDLPIIGKIKFTNPLDLKVC